MSFDKHMGKEHRKQFYGSKLVDSSCRNHGGCTYCYNNRMYHNRKQLLRTEDQLNEDWSNLRHKTP